jgi:hypothetical protein
MLLLLILIVEGAFLGFSSIAHRASVAPAGEYGSMCVGFTNFSSVEGALYNGNAVADGLVKMRPWRRSRAEEKLYAVSELRDAVLYLTSKTIRIAASIWAIAFSWQGAFLRRRRGSKQYCM